MFSLLYFFFSALHPGVCTELFLQMEHNLHCIWLVDSSWDLGTSSGHNIYLLENSFCFSLETATHSTRKVCFSHYFQRLFLKYQDMSCNSKMMFYAFHHQRHKKMLLGHNKTPKPQNLNAQSISESVQAILFTYWKTTSGFLGKSQQTGQEKSCFSHISSACFENTKICHSKSK